MKGFRATSSIHRGVEVVTDGVKATTNGLFWSWNEENGQKSGKFTVLLSNLDSPKTNLHTQGMTLIDKITPFRLVLAPLFFIVYFISTFFPSWFQDSDPWIVFVLWALFIIFDGMAARKRREMGDFGKLYDPFADTLMRITFFLCFVIDGIFPVPLFLVILYRELGVQFIRNLMLRKGIAMDARMGEGIKSVFYTAAAAVALLAVSFRRLEMEEPVYIVIKTTALIIFCVSGLIALISFTGYLFVYKKRVQPFSSS